MQNVVANTYKKFHYDRLRNDRALGNGKSDNNEKSNVALGDPFPGLKTQDKQL